MTSTYNRSEILSFYDLTESQQCEILDLIELEEAEQDSFVIINIKNYYGVLPLSMFMRTENNFTHGVYGTSYFSCYTVTFNRFTDECVVAYKQF